MKILLHLLRKEFKQIFRDPAILRLIFILPAMQLLILPFAADFEIKNVKVGIVDHDHSSYSRALVQKIAHSNYFQLAAYSNSYKASLQWIEEETADLVLEIPANFEKELVREKNADLLMAVNAVDGTKGNIGAAYATSIIREFNQEVRDEWLQSPRYNTQPQVELTHSHWYNKTNNYQVFMVPGILAILLTMVGGFLSALNIVREKEIGTIEQLNVSPVKKYHFILGKLIPFWLLGFIVLTVGLIIAYVVHGVMPGSNIGLLYLFSGVYLLAVMGFGLLISNFTNSQQQAMMVAFFFMLVAILMSGLFTSIESMPYWAQKIAWASPVTYMVDVMRMILLKGAQFADVAYHLLVVALVGLFLDGLAILTYRKQV